MPAVQARAVAELCRGGGKTAPGAQELAPAMVTVQGAGGGGAAAAAGAVEMSVMPPQQLQQLVLQARMPQRPRRPLLLRP